MTAASRAVTVVRSPRDRVSLRVDVRSAAACLALLSTVAGLGAYALSVGDYPLAVRDVLGTLAGRGTPANDFIITTLRLPRALTCLLAGSALGVSGAIFQSLSRNPLASPDIVGFTTGSATGALLVIIVRHGSMSETAVGAVLGGLVTAVVVYLLAYRNGVQGPRLILIGIGVSATLLSVNSYLITRASLGDAIAAQTWLVGSLNGRGWEHVWPVGTAVAVLLPFALYHGRRLSLLEMGDDTARALGVGVERSRLVLVAVGVALVAAATAAAGPIGFVALAAPQIARRLTRSAGPGLIPAALMGALGLQVCDLVTRRAFAPTQLPVGVATGAVGGLYLAWLLVREARRT